MWTLKHLRTLTLAGKFVLERRLSPLLRVPDRARVGVGICFALDHFAPTTTTSLMNSKRGPADKLE
jgi:hypothetical protein